MSSFTQAGPFFVPVSNVRGTAYHQESDRVYFVEQLPYTAGRIRVLRLTPYDLVSQGVIELFDKLYLDGLGDINNPDVLWEGGNLNPMDYAQIAPLLQEKQNPLDPRDLPAQAFQTGSLPEDGNGDHWYAVLTNSQRYSKLRIFRDAQDGNKLKAQWFTYEISTEPEIVSNNYMLPRDILVTVENGVLVAYITAAAGVPGKPTQIQPVIYRVPSQDAYGKSGFENANPAYIVAKFLPVNLPVPQNWSGAQQMAMHLGRLYVVHENTLALVEPGKVPTTLYSDLDRAVGLAISPDGSTAYVTDLKEGGRLLRLKLNPVTGMGSEPTTLKSNLGKPGFLSWADEARSMLYVCRNEANEVLRLEDLDGSPNDLKSAPAVSAADGIVAPWSAEFISEDKAFIACDALIGFLENKLEVSPGVLVLGIGLIPFTYIEQDPSSPDLGRADTSGTGYFFQVNNVPFGGTLNLMLHHEGAYEAGARYYKLRFLQNGKEVPITGSFTDLLWNPSTAKFEPDTSSVKANGVISEAYAIRSPGKLYYNPYMAALLDTRKLSNGVATLEVTFYNTTGTKLDSFTANRFLRIDNNPVSAKLSLPVIGGVVQPLSDCGTLRYHAKTDDFRFNFVATHPNNDAEYSLYIQRGNTVISSLSERGPVANAAPPKVTTVQTVLGACSVGNVYIRLDVWSRVTDGYRWINSTATALSFTLVPDTVAMH